MPRECTADATAASCGSGLGGVRGAEGGANFTAPEDFHAVAGRAIIAGRASEPGLASGKAVLRLWNTRCQGGRRPVPALVERSRSWQSSTGEWMQRTSSDSGGGAA